MANNRVQTVMGESGGYASGQLVTGALTKVLSMAQAPLPATATLVSTAGNRLIELSTDGGNNFFTPTLDVNVTAFINVAIKAPVSHIRFTGVNNDTWSVR